MPQAEATTSAPTARELLLAVANATEGRAVLWRGAPATGGDVDILVPAGTLPRVAEVLRARGLRSGPGDRGHIVWRPAAGADRTRELDILPAGRWPTRYPSLDGVLARARAGREPLPESSPEDRLLIYAGDALTGRPIAELTERARGLLAEPGVPERLEAVARQDGLTPLAALIYRPGSLRARARRGRLTYATTALIALRSRAARAALADRVARRLGLGQSGLLVTISGMDGAGKSTVAAAAAAALEDAGRPATTTWARFGQEAATLDALARPVKRLVRRRGTVADPVAAGGPGVGKSQDPQEAAGRRRAVSWVWVLLVAAVNARTLRLSARPRREGLSVVCDRWMIDSLVDLRLRYGTHRAAELVLSGVVPRPDLGFFLDIDRETAARRKPGDQDPSVLARARGLYEEGAHRRGLVRVDAGLPPEEVARAVGERVRVLAQ